MTERFVFAGPGSILVLEMYGMAIDLTDYQRINVTEMHSEQGAIHGTGLFLSLPSEFGPEYARDDVITRDPIDMVTIPCSFRVFFDDEQGTVIEVIPDS